MAPYRTGPLTPRPSLDAHVGLALGLTARPGATAVLAGAGLSVGAGVPAAWQVQRELLGRAAAAAGDSPVDPFVWWREKTGVDAAYDAVLYATARTPSARKDLLSPMFEPTEQERAAGVKVPSAGHRALARLMRDGLVRVVVTLNFDRLIETALRELGVEPTVISTVDDVRGMEPLHMQKHLVWHLHGDYTNPEMLNTPDELREYDPVVNVRLDELFDQYGLLVVGWSTEWDPPSMTSTRSSRMRPRKVCRYHSRFSGEIRIRPSLRRRISLSVGHRPVVSARCRDSLKWKRAGCLSPRPALLRSGGAPAC